MRQQLEETYGRLAFEPGPHRLTLTRDEYVSHFLGNYEATYQSRAALALGMIGTPAAQRALAAAWTRVTTGQASYRGDVVIAIRAGLNRASHLTVEISSAAVDTARVGDTVTTAPAVLVKNADGTPAGGVGVTFVTSSGRVRDADQVTDTTGVARVGAWRLGVRPGLDTLRARVPGVPPALFTAVAEARLPFIYVLAGDNQRARLGDTLQLGPTVLVTDGSGHPLGGQVLRFDVVGTSVHKTLVTNARGIARWGPWAVRDGVNRVVVYSPLASAPFPSVGFIVATLF